MKTLRILILLAFLTSINHGIFSQHENTDAVYLKLVKEYILHEDGSYDFHYHKEVKLLTYFSFHRLYGETFIVYNPEFQQLKINDCYTIMADGKKVVAPENAFNEVLPGFARDAAAYNHLREMVVTHTGLEKNAVVTLDYTIHSSGSFLPNLMGNEQIGEDVPVNEMMIIVRIPSSVRLNYKMQNNRTAPEIFELGGQTSYTWSLMNLKALPKDGYIVTEQMPRLLFSTAKDLTWAFFSFVNQPAFKKMISPEMSKKAEALMKEKTDEIDLILALQDLVIDQVKLVDIPPVYTGFRVRTPAETWKSANATVLEKAILLSELLIQANINAEPVATIPANQFDLTHGNLMSFDNYLVQVNPKKYGRIYLSVNQKNEQNLIYNLKDYTVLVLDGTVESLRYFNEKPEKNSISLTGTLNLADTAQLNGSLKLLMEGYKNPYLKLKRDESGLKNYVTGGISAGHISVVEEIKLTQPHLEATLKIDRKQAFKKENDYLFVELPALTNGLDQWQPGLLSEKRDVPLKLPVTISESYSFELIVPAGYRMVNPKKLMELENSAGTVKISIEQKDNKVTVKRLISLENQVINPQDYSAFLELIHAWVDRNFRELVFDIRP